MMELPLVAFERYMLADDRPSHPMSLWVRLVFEGRLDWERMENALAQTSARHPLTTAVVRERRLRRPTWRQASSTVAVRRRADPARADGRSPAIDIRCEPGLRAWFDERAAEPIVWLQFHHVCCDGVGALQFADDLLRAYADPQWGSDCEAVEMQRRLRGRSRVKVGMSRGVRRTPHTVRRLRDYFFRQPMEIGRRAAEPFSKKAAAEGELGTCILTDRIPATDFARIQQETRRRRVTINDWLLSSLFQTLKEWSERHPGLARGQWRRIAVPINMRMETDGAMPCANKVSMVFIDRGRDDPEGRDELLPGIHREMHLVKEHRLGTALWRTLDVASMLPGGLAMVLRPGACASTAVLSNWGVAFANGSSDQERVTLGSAALAAVDVFSPVRPGTPAAFSACTYRGRMSLNLRYMSPELGPAEAEDLHGTFVRNVLLCSSEV
jgi:hypothetical protein